LVPERNFVLQTSDGRDDCVTNLPRGEVRI